MLLLLQLEVVEPGAALAAFPVEVRDELLDRDAPVDRGVATARRRDELLDWAVPPHGPPHVDERRHGDPRRARALVRQDPVLHAPEPAVADELHAREPRETANNDQPCR